MPSSPMNKERLIPLIVATALFMENMDSTVIAPSLPAIAADMGTNPLTLKLAITLDLLSLAGVVPPLGLGAMAVGGLHAVPLAHGGFLTARTDSPTWFTV